MTKVFVKRTILFLQWPCVLHSSNHHCKKEMVILTLLRLSQLQLNDIMSFPWTLSSYFSYTLGTDGIWAMYRVSSSSGGLSGRVNDSPLVY